MGSEAPDKSRDFHECKACGTKENVVKKAAEQPIKSVDVMQAWYLNKLRKLLFTLNQNS